MVKKLIKYDLLSIFRKLLPFEAILIGIAFFSRITQIFENDTVTYKICFVSSVVLYCIALVSSIIVAFIVCISHIYKNLYTLEGYLSFTLPVTTHQHIRAKLISTFIATLFTIVVGILSVFIITFGDVANEILKAGSFLISRAYQFTKLHIFGYGFELLIFLILTILTEYLLIFACITLGQTAKKNRVLASFGFYFLWYVISQIFGTVLVIIISAVTAAISQETVAKILEFVSKHYFGIGHAGMILAIIFELILFAFYYFVTNRVMKRKLNLE